MDSGFYKDMIKDVESMLDRKETDCGSLQDVPLYRAQGAAEALRKVLGMPQKIIDRYAGKKT